MNNFDTPYLVCTLALGITIYYVLFIKKIPEYFLERYSSSQNNYINLFFRIVKIIFQVITFHDTVRMLVVITLVFCILSGIEYIDDLVYELLH